MTRRPASRTVSTIHRNPRSRAAGWYSRTSHLPAPRLWRPGRPRRSLPGSRSDVDPAGRSLPMMRWIVAWSLQFRVLVVGLAVAMMGLGVAQLRQAPVDVFPEFAPTYVQIQTEALGLSAAEVEQLITVPMEQL